MTGSWPRCDRPGIQRMDRQPEVTTATSARIVIRNDNTDDFGNALIFDNLQWLPYVPAPTFLAVFSPPDNP